MKGAKAWAQLVYPDDACVSRLRFLESVDARPCATVPATSVAALAQYSRFIVRCHIRLVATDWETLSLSDFTYLHASVFCGQSPTKVAGTVAQSRRNDFWHALRLSPQFKR